MKKLIFLFLLVTISNSFSQFKDQSDRSPDIKSGIVKEYSSSLFGFFNPDNFKMHHTFDLSYQTSGFGNVALSVYTNSMFYKINDQLNLQADISLVNSPYNSFGKNFSSQINGLYLSRAQINYKPTENMSIIIQYRSIPYGYNSPYSWYGYSPFYRSQFYENSPFEKE